MCLFYSAVHLFVEYIYYDQEQGVPQGGVLSTTLFSIKINDIVKCLGNLTDCSLYVDDFCICYRSKSMATIERQLQQNLNKIENWATSNGFKFSKSKTQCVHFCQLRKQHDDPVLHLYGSPIPVVEESKFLGILFDGKLSFIPHIKYLKAKCLKALNLLKVLSHNKQAKTSLSLEPTFFKIPFSNFKPSINKYILEEWQTSWNNSIGNKLLDIKPTIGEYQSVVRNIRREEVVLARLRLGHTRATHSYLLQGEEQPQCVGCDAPFTVRHFLLECGDFAQVRNNCFHVDNMKELFQDIHIDSIMTFLRQINLFNKI